MAHQGDAAVAGQSVDLQCDLAVNSAAEGFTPHQCLALEAMDIDKKGPDEGVGGVTWRGFNRNEVLMLLLQTLDEMGFEDVARSLEDASGVKLLPAPLQSMKEQIMLGRWEEAKQTLDTIPVSEDRKRGCWFLMMQHKFLEAVVDPNLSLTDKLLCLRENLTPAVFDAATADRLHECTALLMYPTENIAAHVMRLASLSRKQLFMRISCMLPSHVVIQPSRLAVLLSYARRFQALCCPFHLESVKVEPPTLLRPHICVNADLPLEAVGYIRHHKSEVWSVAVSNNKERCLIASGSKDTSVCVWSVVHTQSHNSVEKPAATPQVESKNLQSETSVVADEPMTLQLRECGSSQASGWEGAPASGLTKEAVHPLRSGSSGREFGTCTLIWQSAHFQKPVSALSWDSSGRLLAAGTMDGYISIWEEGRRVEGYPLHEGSLVALQWVPGTARLISVGSERTMYLLSHERQGSNRTRFVDYEWTFSSTPQEAFVLPNSDGVIVFFYERIKVFDLESKREVVS